MTKNMVTFSFPSQQPPSSGVGVAAATTWDLTVYQASPEYYFF